MRTVYIRELSLHTPSSLGHILHTSPDEAMRYIELLCAHGALKLCTSNNKKDRDFSHGEPVRETYQFIYVGLVLIDDLCIILYPKYIPETDANNPDAETWHAMQQVFRVLRKNRGSYSSIIAISEENIHANSRLPLMLALLEMHDEYGVYSNHVKTLTDNGAGEINWERTIATNLPFMSNGNPIYINYKTIETNQDAADFVMRLHQAVLTDCSRFMQKSGLASLLSLDEIWLTDTTTEDFGDTDFITYRLEQERGTQFVTWKQDVIALLLRYVNEDDSTVRQDTPLCLGTSSFYHVWEEACKVAFDDALNKPLVDLGVKLADPFAQIGNTKLINIIPKPQWTAFVDDDEKGCGKVATLIPDTVLLRHDAMGNNVFAILDAKYYTPELGAVVNGVPGVESITKQFLYQAAYRPFVLAHGYTRVVNAFLTPSAKPGINHTGRVRFPGVIAPEEPPFSNVLELYSLSAEMIFNAYLADTPLDTETLFAIIGSPKSDNDSIRASEFINL